VLVVLLAMALLTTGATLTGCHYCRDGCRTTVTRLPLPGDLVDSPAKRR